MAPYAQVSEPARKGSNLDDHHREAMVYDNDHKNKQTIMGTRKIYHPSPESAVRSCFEG
jgi:predicted nuclease with TOPRIM domain